MIIKSDVGRVGRGSDPQKTIMITAGCEQARGMNGNFFCWRSLPEAGNHEKTSLEGYACLLLQTEENR